MAEQQLRSNDELPGGSAQPVLQACHERPMLLLLWLGLLLLLLLLLSSPLLLLT